MTLGCPLTLALSPVTGRDDIHFVKLSYMIRKQKPKQIP